LAAATRRRGRRRGGGRAWLRRDSATCWQRRRCCWAYGSIRCSSSRSCAVGPRKNFYRGENFFDMTGQDLASPCTRTQPSLNLRRFWTNFRGSPPCRRRTRPPTKSPHQGLAAGHRRFSDGALPKRGGVHERCSDPREDTRMTSLGEPRVFYPPG